MYTEEEIIVLFRDSCKITLEEVALATKTHVSQYPSIEETAQMILDSLHKCVSGPIDIAANSMQKLQEVVDYASRCGCEDNKNLHGYFKDVSNAFDKGARHLNHTITQRIFADYDVTEFEAKLIFLAVQNGLGVLGLAEMMENFNFKKRETPLPETQLDVPNDLSLEKEFDDPTLP